MGRKRSRNPKKTAENELPENKSSLEDSLLLQDSIVENLSEKTSPEQDSILFERYLRNSSRVQGRRYFVNSLCQVCKEDVKDEEECKGCGLVRYCSTAHRQEDQDEHGELCAGVRAVCAARGVAHLLSSAHNTTPDEYRLLRYHNMAECERTLGRPMESFEREMFVFPRVCQVCHEYKRERLVVCKSCKQAAFCRSHEIDSKAHRESCNYLQRYRRVVRDQCLEGLVLIDLPSPKIASTSPSLTNMDSFFSLVKSELHETEFIELTEQATYPLTTLNAIMSLPQLVSRPKLTVHVVGAEAEFETNKLEKWELYLLHLLPTLEHLEVDFIGPELNAVKPKGLRTCRKCREVKKSMSVKFHNGMYHTLGEKQGVNKPDMLCVFNPGLYRGTGFAGQDSWTPSISSMVKRGCPLLVTAYTAKEANMDLDRLRQIHPQYNTQRPPTVNPFSSMKPSLNFVSDEESPVIFKNRFYFIVF